MEYPVWVTAGYYMLEANLLLPKEYFNFNVI